VDARFGRHGVGWLRLNDGSVGVRVGEMSKPRSGCDGLRLEGAICRQLGERGKPRRSRLEARGQLGSHIRLNHVQHSLVAFFACCFIYNDP
jgi:hypothetical protein